MVANRYPSCSNDKRKLKGKVSASAVFVLLSLTHGCLRCVHSQGHSASPPKYTSSVFVKFPVLSNTFVPLYSIEYPPPPFPEESAIWNRYPTPSVEGRHPTNVSVEYGSDSA